MSGSGYSRQKSPILQYPSHGTSLIFRKVHQTEPPPPHTPSFTKGYSGVHLYAYIEKYHHSVQSQGIIVASQLPQQVIDTQNKIHTGYLQSTTTNNKPFINYYFFKHIMYTNTHRWQTNPTHSPTAMASQHLAFTRQSFGMPPQPSPTISLGENILHPQDLATTTHPNIFRIWLQQSRPQSMPKGVH